MSAAVQIAPRKMKNGSAKTQKVEIFSMSNFKNRTGDMTLNIINANDATSNGSTNAAFSDDNGVLQLGVKDLRRDIQNSNVQLDLKPERMAGCTSSPEDQNKCRRTVICSNCLAYVCPGCHSNQHPGHDILNVGPSAQRVNSFLQDYSDAVRLSIKQRFDYQQSLDSAIQNSKSQYETAASEIEIIYDRLIERLNEERVRRHIELELVMKKFEANTETIRDENRIVIDKQRDISQIIDTQKSDGSAVLGDLRINEFKLNPPLSLITRQVNITLPDPETILQHLIVPDIHITSTTTTSCLPEPEHTIPKLQMELQTTIGKRGNGQAEFLLPSGVCIADDSSLFVADEGNSRIQKIDGNGLMSGSFTWKEVEMTMTDVAYDRTKKQIVVPRASSKHGMLSCNSFSLVSLNGEEKGRFNVPDMVGGIFIHCSNDGKYLITDVTKKSLSVIKDGQLLKEIKDTTHLKQPAHACFGNNDEILAVDSNRRNVTVFDSRGQFVRDLITPEVMIQSELKKPSGISYSINSGLIALSDWCGDRVHMYSYSGHLLTTLPGFKCPHSVQLTEYNKLVISDCWNSQVKIYSYTSQE